MAKSKSNQNPPHVSSNPPNMTTRSGNSRQSRKIYNCIVDESALIAGVKAATLKKWIIRGDIVMFVPLQTLERLRILSSAPERIGADSRTALRWLDEITNQTDSPAVSRIKIEGPSEQYASWSEVEKFMLPMSLLSLCSESVSSSIIDSEEKKQTALGIQTVQAAQPVLTEQSAQNPTDNVNNDDINVESDRPSTQEDARKSIAELYTDEGEDLSDFGSPTSRETSEEPDYKINSSPRIITSSVPSSPFLDSSQKLLQPIGTGRPYHRKSDSTTSTTSSIGTVSTARPQSRRIGDEVPDSLRQFFNHIMWRIKQDPTTTNQLESYILLTNDNAKQILASRFGIRTKRLDQMRDIIDQEDGTKLKTKKGAVLAPAAPIKESNGPSELHTDDDDVVLLQPRNSTISKKSSSSTTRNDNQQTQPQSPNKPQHVFDPNSFGRTPAGPSTSNANRGSRGSRNYVSQSPKSNHSARFERPPSSSGRGALYTPRRGGTQQPQNSNQPLDLSQPIDPDAFSRATSNTPRGGGRGNSGRRRLWEPS